MYTLPTPTKVNCVKNAKYVLITPPTPTEISYESTRGENVLIHDVRSFADSDHVERSSLVTNCTLNMVINRSTIS